MSNEQELTKSVNEIPTPWGRTLVFVLLIAAATLYVQTQIQDQQRNRKCDEQHQRDQEKIDSLENAAYIRAEQNSRFNEDLKTILKTKVKQ